MRSRKARRVLPRLHAPRDGGSEGAKPVSRRGVIVMQTPHAGPTPVQADDGPGRIGPVCLSQPRLNLTRGAGPIV